MGICASKATPDGGGPNTREKPNQPGKPSDNKNKNKNNNNNNNNNTPKGNKTGSGSDSQQQQQSKDNNNNKREPSHVSGKRVSGKSDRPLLPADNNNDNNNNNNNNPKNNNTSNNSSSGDEQRRSLTISANKAPYIFDNLDDYSDSDDDQYEFEEGDGIIHQSNSKMDFNPLTKINKLNKRHNGNNSTPSSSDTSNGSGPNRLEEEQAYLGVPLFDSLAPKDLPLISRIFYRAQYVAGEIIRSPPIRWTLEAVPKPSQDTGSIVATPMSTNDVSNNSSGSTTSTPTPDSTSLLRSSSSLTNPIMPLQRSPPSKSHDLSDGGLIQDSSDVKKENSESSKTQPLNKKSTSLSDDEEIEVDPTDHLGEDVLHTSAKKLQQSVENHLGNSTPIVGTTNTSITDVHQVPSSLQIDKQSSIPLTPVTPSGNNNTTTSTTTTPTSTSQSQSINKNKYQDLLSLASTDNNNVLHVIVRGSVALYVHNTSIQQQYIDHLIPPHCAGCVTCHQYLIPQTPQKKRVRGQRPEPSLTVIEEGPDDTAPLSPINNSHKLGMLSEEPEVGFGGPLGSLAEDEDGVAINNVINNTSTTAHNNNNNKNNENAGDDFVLVEEVGIPTDTNTNTNNNYTMMDNLDNKNNKDATTGPIVSFTSLALPPPPCHHFLCEYTAGQLFTTEKSIEINQVENTTLHSIAIALDHAVILSIPISILASVLTPYPKLQLSLSVPLASLSSTNFTISLQNIPFFRHMSPQKLSILSRLFTIRKAAGNRVIFREGQRSDGVYLLLDGLCEVTAKSSHNKPVYLNTIITGQWFGEHAMVGIDVRENKEPISTPATNSIPNNNNNNNNNKNNKNNTQDNEETQAFTRRPRALPRASTVTTLKSSTFLFLHRRRLRRFFALAPELLNNHPTDGAADGLDGGLVNNNNNSLVVSTIPKPLTLDGQTFLDPITKERVYDLSMVALVHEEVYLRLNDDDHMLNPDNSVQINATTGEPLIASDVHRDLYRDYVQRIAAENPPTGPSNPVGSKLFSAQQQYKQELSSFSSLLSYRSGEILKTISLFSSLQRKVVGAKRFFDEHRLQQLCEIMEWIYLDSPTMAANPNGNLEVSQSNSLITSQNTSSNNNNYQTHSTSHGQHGSNNNSTGAQNSWENDSFSRNSDTTFLHQYPSLHTAKTYYVLSHNEYNGLYNEADGELTPGMFILVRGEVKVTEHRLKYTQMKNYPYPVDPNFLPGGMMSQKTAESPRTGTHNLDGQKSLGSPTSGRGSGDMDYDFQLPAYLLEGNNSGNGLGFDKTGEKDNRKKNSSPAPTVPLSPKRRREKKTKLLIHTDLDQTEELLTSSTGVTRIVKAGDYFGEWLLLAPPSVNSDGFSQKTIEHNNVHVTPSSHGRDRGSSGAGSKGSQHHQGRGGRTNSNQFDSPLLSQSHSGHNGRTKSGSVSSQGSGISGYSPRNTNLANQGRNNNNNNNKNHNDNKKSHREEKKKDSPKPIRILTVTPCTPDTLLLVLPCRSFQRFSSLCPEIWTSIRARYDNIEAQLCKAQLQRNGYLLSIIQENRSWSKLENLSSMWKCINIPRGSQIYNCGQHLFTKDGVNLIASLNASSKTGTTQPLNAGALSPPLVQSQHALVNNAIRTFHKGNGANPTLHTKQQQQQQQQLQSPQSTAEFAASTTSSTISRLQTLSYGTDIPCIFILIQGHIDVSIPHFAPGYIDAFDDGTFESRIRPDGSLLVEVLEPSDIFGYFPRATQPTQLALARHTCLTDCMVLMLPLSQIFHNYAISPELHHYILKSLKLRLENIVKILPYINTLIENRRWSKQELVATFFRSFSCDQHSVIIGTEEDVDVYRSIYNQQQIDLKKISNPTAPLTTPTTTTTTPTAITMTTTKNQSTTSSSSSNPTIALASQYATQPIPISNTPATPQIEKVVPLAPLQTVVPMVNTGLWVLLDGEVEIIRFQHHEARNGYLQNQQLTNQQHLNNNTNGNFQLSSLNSNQTNLQKSFSINRRNPNQNFNNNNGAGGNSTNDQNIPRTQSNIPVTTTLTRTNSGSNSQGASSSNGIVQRSQSGIVGSSLQLNPSATTGANKNTDVTTQSHFSKSSNKDGVEFDIIGGEEDECAKIHRSSVSAMSLLIDHHNNNNDNPIEANPTPDQTNADQPIINHLDDHLGSAAALIKNQEGLLLQDKRIDPDCIVFRKKFSRPIFFGEELLLLDLIRSQTEPGVRSQSQTDSTVNSSTTGGARVFSRQKKLQLEKDSQSIVSTSLFEDALDITRYQSYNQQRIDQFGGSPNDETGSVISSITVNTGIPMNGSTIGQTATNSTITTPTTAPPKPFGSSWDLFIPPPPAYTTPAPSKVIHIPSSSTGGGSVSVQSSTGTPILHPQQPPIGTPTISINGGQSGNNNNNTTNNNGSSHHHLDAQSTGSALTGPYTQSVPYGTIPFIKTPPTSQIPYLIHTTKPSTFLVIHDHNDLLRLLNTAPEFMSMFVDLIEAKSRQPLYYGDVAASINEPTPLRQPNGLLDDGRGCGECESGLPCLCGILPPNWTNLCDLRSYFNLEPSMSFTPSPQQSSVASIASKNGLFVHSHHVNSNNGQNFKANSIFGNTLFSQIQTRDQALVADSTGNDPTRDDLLNTINIHGPNRKQSVLGLLPMSQYGYQYNHSTDPNHFFYPNETVEEPYEEPVIKTLAEAKMEKGIAPSIVDQHGQPTNGTMANPNIKELGQGRASMRRSGGESRPSLRLSLNQQLGNNGRSSRVGLFSIAARQKNNFLGINQQPQHPQHSQQQSSGHNSPTNDVREEPTADGGIGDDFKLGAPSVGGQISRPHSSHSSSSSHHSGSTRTSMNNLE